MNVQCDAQINLMGYLLSSVEIGTAFRCLFLGNFACDLNLLIAS